MKNTTNMDYMTNHLKGESDDFKDKEQKYSGGGHRTPIL